MKKDPEELLLDAVVDIRNQVLDDILSMIDTSIAYRSYSIREEHTDQSTVDQYLYERSLLRSMRKTISSMKWEEEGEDSY